MQLALHPLTTWQWLAFEALSRDQLYALLRLRSEVFVVEQNCVFLDLDGLDTKAMHLLGLQATATGAELVAYARCFPSGVTFAEASIGRVVTSPRARAQRLGHTLMTEAVRALQVHWGVQPMRIGAQAHLKSFYEQHGFADAGLAYVEDGIPHLEMLRPK